jgi:two-component system response regulator FixJ
VRDQPSSTLQSQLRARRISVPVIVLTGHADVPLAVEAMKEGAADFIEKPFEDDRLIGAIRSALESRRKGGELRGCRSRSSPF